MNVMIIDDEEDICEILKDFIQEMGDHNVTCSHKPVENVNDYDLVICDVGASKNNMFKVGDHPETNLVWITGDPSFVDSKRRVIYKPFTYEKIEEVLDGCK